MSQFSISPDASRDLKEIIDYFTAQNVEAGENFVNEFENKCKYLTRFPQIGRSYSEIAPNLRGLPLMKYIILYQVINDRITILRVVSGYRNLPSLFVDE